MRDDIQRTKEVSVPNTIRKRSATAHTTRSNRRPLVAGILVVLVFVMGAVVYGFVNHQGVTAGYHAVFLSNGQVYFGTLTEPKAQYVMLTGVYYFGRTDSEAAADDLALVKLGSEVHGPADILKINRDHILFIEELRADSRVVEAMKDHTKNSGE